MRIALTFDDGPNTTITPQVLDILEEHGIAASFFLIADNINPESAQQVRRAMSLGCDIQNHSRTHGFMNQMTPEQIREEICFCSDRIIEITGKAPTFFRPRARRVLATAEDGEIVLLHDMTGNINTVEALKTIIPELKQQGFSFCTVPQLFEECGVTPVRNRIYSNVYQTADRV